MALDTASFNLNRTLPLPPARLWEVLTDAAHRGTWASPEPGMTLDVVAADVRVGGSDRHRYGPQEAPEFEVETRWYDLTGPDRAVFTETLIFGGEAACMSLVTYGLTADGDGTALEVSVAMSSFSGPDTLAEYRMGWEGGLANLEGHAKGLATA